MDAFKKRKRLATKERSSTDNNDGNDAELPEPNDNAKNDKKDGFNDFVKLKAERKKLVAELSEEDGENEKHAALLLAGSEAIKIDATRQSESLEAPAAKRSHFGPQRTSAHIRSTVRFDYQPDVCKDYMETGYCTFGDACKFLHVRGEMKPRKVDKAGNGKSDAEEQLKQQEEKPFGCHICRSALRNPVKTLCGHLFCESCAVSRFATNKECAICGKDTMGTFNAP